MLCLHKEIEYGVPDYLNNYFIKCAVSQKSTYSRNKFIPQEIPRY